MFGPYEGRHHDRFLLNVSQLLELCHEHAIKPGTTPQSAPIDRHFQLFGDPAYSVSSVILSPFSSNGRTPQQLAWNTAMSAVRIEVEDIFGILSKTWPFLNAHWKMRAFASPVGAYYRTAALLTNAMTCIRGNQISAAFSLPPPSLEEYLID